MTQSLELPRTLLDAVREQRAILFLGAGASADAVSASGAKMPNGQQLANEIARRFLNDRYLKHDLMAVSEIAISEHGMPVVYSFLRDFLSQFAPTATHTKLAAFRWKAIATTNYDLLIERAYQTAPERLQDLIQIVKDDDPFEFRMSQVEHPVPYFKLHGCLDHIGDPQIPLVLTPDSYNTHSQYRKRLFDRISSDAHEYPVIFCGYSLKDLHIRDIVSKISVDKRPFFYIVTRSAEPEEQRMWSARRVQPIVTSFSKFVDQLDRELPGLMRRPAVRTSTQQRPVRRHFRTNEEESDALNLALQRDLEFVHSAVPSPEQTAKEFYAGFDRGWSSIRQSFDVHRRPVAQLIEQIVSSEGDPLYAFLGPGGYGKTVALKRAAWELATSFDLLVVWLREGGRMNPSVFEELAQQTGKRVYLFIDRAALHHEQIHALLDATTSKGVPLSVVTAERVNEWNVHCARLTKYKPVTLSVDRLSRAEVERLVELLEQHICLGVLGELSHPERVNLISEKLDRQLLVVLHEVTQGRPFEDIVLDEYNGIVPDAAQRLYLDICTLHQFGVPVRAGLVSRVSGLRFEDFEAEFFEPLETLILTEKHPTIQDHVYKARHSRVAEMVFNRVCDSDFLRAEQFKRMLEGIDIGYASDLSALSGMVRGRSIAEALEDEVLAREVYDAAENAAPGAAFVFQQQAIFEYTHPRGNLVLATEAAERARGLAPENGSIIHTQAEVARRSAQLGQTDYQRMGLRRIARKFAQEMPATNDRFSLSIKGKILVDEVEELVTKVDESAPDWKTEELTEKVNEAQRSLFQALQLYPDEPDLLQTDARFRALLGHEAKAIELLERAWRKKPKGSGVAIRLGKVFRERGEREREIAILREALDRDPNDKSAHLELARSLFIQDDFGDRGAAKRHLQLSYVRGDRNLVARFLHASLLYCEGSYDKAMPLFGELEKSKSDTKLRLSESEDWILDSGKNRAGRLVNKLATYSFINLPGAPKNIYAPEHRSYPDNWDALRNLTEVAFDLDFNRKGPLAINVRTR